MRVRSFPGGNLWPDFLGGRHGSTPEFPSLAQNRGLALASPHPQWASGLWPFEHSPVRPPAESQRQSHRGPKGGAGKGAATLCPIWPRNPGLGAGGRLGELGQGQNPCLLSSYSGIGWPRLLDEFPSPGRPRPVYPHGPEPPGGARTGASSEAPVQVRVPGKCRGIGSPNLRARSTCLSRGPSAKPPSPHFCPVMYIVPFFWRPQVHREEA